MITTKEQMIGTCIKNDRCELLEAYYNKAVELGAHTGMLSLSYYTSPLKGDLVFCIEHCSSLQTGISNTYCREGYKELTLKDFQEDVEIFNRDIKFNEVSKLKKTKQIKVPCNFTSFHNALTEMQRIGGMFYAEGVIERVYNASQISFYKDECLFALQSYYKTLYRLEDHKLADTVLDYIDKSDTLCRTDTLGSLGRSFGCGGVILSQEFVGLCKLVVEFSERK